MARMQAPGRMHSVESAILERPEVCGSPSSLGLLKDRDDNQDKLRDQARMKLYFEAEEPKPKDSLESQENVPKIEQKSEREKGNSLENT